MHRTRSGSATSRTSAPGGGWLYLAALIDLASRRVVDFHLDDNMRSRLPLRALQSARRHRQPGRGLVHHSDRGSQYASKAYRRELDDMGAVQSMSGKGNCFDNAVAESFFSTIKTDLIHRHAWPTQRAATAAVTDYIDNFYNPFRRHSAVGFMSPIEFEFDYKRPAIAA